MKQELDDRLVKKYPNLYADRHGNMRDTLMCFGFECGDGWYNLLDELSSKLEPLILEYRKNNPEDDCFPRAVQVKEKFATLRFYMTSATDEMYKIITEYENRSAATCEHCGAKGKVRKHLPWLLTLCGSCLRKHLKERGLTYNYSKGILLEKILNFKEFFIKEKNED